MKMKAYIQKLPLRALFLSLLTATVFTSCDKDNEAEDLFGKNADARLEQQEKELREALLSSEHGWKVIYFTDDPRYTNDDQQLGGWSFIFDFNDNKHVTMASDFSAETLTPQQSEYDVRLGSTIKLSFVTKNYIHLLSDSDNSPTSSLEGQGYKGDFEFLYYGKEGEDLIFRSNRFQIELRFEKATAQDWTDLAEARQTASLLANSGTLELEIKNGGEITTYNSYGYDRNSRFAVNTEVDNLSFGVAPLANGLKVVKPIPVGDQEATDFVYDSSNNWFIASFENGDYAKIIIGEPVKASDIVDEYYFGALRSSGHPFLGSSDEFFTMFLDGEETLRQETDVDVLYGFFIVPDFGFIQYLFIDDNGDLIEPRPNRIISSFSVDDAAGTITLVDGGWQNPAHSIYDNGLQALHDVLFDPQGLKIIQSGTFEGEPVFILESSSDPSMVIVTGGIPY